MFGVDLSAQMVAVARKRNPEIEFRVEDMQRLSASDGSLSGIVLFYSIVHYDWTELPEVFREARRVIADGGLALIAIHAGDDIVHRDELFGVPVSLDFQSHLPHCVIEVLRAEGFAVIEEIHRKPCEDVQYPSRRCYLVERAA